MSFLVFEFITEKFPSLCKAIQCCNFLTTACHPGYGENENGECVACGDGWFGSGESPCMSCGPNTNTGGNDNATESSQCGTLPICGEPDPRLCYVYSDRLNQIEGKRAFYQHFVEPRYSSLWTMSNHFSFIFKLLSSKKISYAQKKDGVRKAILKEMKYAWDIMKNFK